MEPPPWRGGFHLIRPMSIGDDALDGMVAGGAKGVGNITKTGKHGFIFVTVL